MNAVGWALLTIFVVCLLGLATWFLAERSLVRIPPGRVGLIMVRGRATDRALPPGTHWVPALRRHAVAEYPSVQLAYRAGQDGPSSELEQQGPPLELTLGDGAWARLPYTVRFRIEPERLRGIHEQLGPDGLFSYVRDQSAKVVAAVLGRPSTGLRDLSGPLHQDCGDSAATALAEVLARQGFGLEELLLGTPDLGLTGQVIQATVRAPYQLDLENAAAGTRLAQAEHDAELVTRAETSPETARMYRQLDLWREALPQRGAPPRPADPRLQPWLTPVPAPAAATAGSAGEDQAS